MQVSVETTQGLERRMTITVPAETVDSEVKKQIQQEARRAKIDGFRPGKVPVSVIKKRYGAAIRQQVAGDVMQKNFVEAIVAEKLNPAGMPRFEPKTDVDGQDLEFVATFEVYPEVELSGLDSIKVERPVVEIKDEDLDEMLVTLQKQHAKWAEVEREAKDGDRANIDFLGSIDGEEFEGGKAEGFDLELGQGRMIPGFEDGITGKKAGEEVTIDVTFPEDYHAENLKGKAAQFAIKVNKVEELDLPEINEEFAKLFGVDDVDALKAEVTKNMQRELDQALKAQVKDQVLKGLTEANQVDLPQALIDSEVNALRQQAMQRFGGQGQNLPELPADLFTDNAKQRVAVGLLLGEVIKQNELKVDDERVTALIESIASAYEDPTEVVNYYKGNNEMMQQMRNVALEEQAVDLLLEKADVTDVEKKFNDVMNKQG